MKLPLVSAPKSLCILRLSAIGDVSHILPTLRIIQKAWPNTKITWIIGKTELNLVKDIQNVEFIPFDKSNTIKSHRELRTILHSRRFDILLHMQVSLRASLISLHLKAPIRIGFDNKRAKNLQWLFTNFKIPHTPHQHVLDSFLEFPKLLGLETQYIDWDIPVPTEAIDKANKLFSNNNTPILAVNPCSSVRINNYRNWDIESYAKIIDFASEKLNMPTILTGGPSDLEQKYAAAIADLAHSTPINMVGKTNLKELLAILKRASAMIAPDTGPAHLANAVGTPVIGLYATSNPDRTGPYSFRELTINKYPEALKEEFNKSVEQVPWGQRVRNPDAMNYIQEHDVIEKLKEIMI